MEKSLLNINCDGDIQFNLVLEKHEIDAIKNAMKENRKIHIGYFEARKYHKII